MVSFKDLSPELRHEYAKKGQFALKKKKEEQNAKNITSVNEKYFICITSIITTNSCFC